MEDEYDYIVLGTGLKECVLSGLLSVAGKKVLHMDRNDYYGGNEASLNLLQLEKYVKGEEEKIDEDALKKTLKDTYGSFKSFSVDLCPKFIMANGNLVKMLLKTKVTRYLEFKCIDGSFVLNSAVQQGKSPIAVPVSPWNAMKSSLLGMFQKRRYAQFLKWVLNVNQADKTTWDKCELDVDATGAAKWTPKQLVDYWKLEEATTEFSGHSIALYTNDNYLTNARETWPFLKRMQLYAMSLARYEKSPYIYPIWGLGGLPEGFSRLAAVHGGVYMLRRPVKKINYNDKGMVTGVTVNVPKMDGSGSEEQTAKLKEGGKVLGDPTYFIGSDKVEKRNFKIARWIIMLNDSDAFKVMGWNGKGEIKEVRADQKTKQSCQVIITAKHAKRPHDIYVSIGGAGLQIAPAGFSILTISSRVVSNTEVDQKKELATARGLITKEMKVHGEYFIVRDCYSPKNDPRKDGTFITSTMDATTHFQTATSEVMTIYKLMTGTAVDLSADVKDLGKDE